MIHATCGANMCKIHLWIPQLLFFVPKLAKTSSFFLGVLFDLKVSTGFIQKRRHSNIFIDIFHPGTSEFNKNIPKILEKHHLQNPRSLRQPVLI